MSLMDDIRAQMAREPGPVTPADIAEKLGEDAAKVRNAMYQAANQAAGIMRDDETREYSLIPGWRPKGAEAAVVAAAAATLRNPLSATPATDPGPAEGAASDPQLTVAKPAMRQKSVPRRKRAQARPAPAKRRVGRPRKHRSAAEAPRKRRAIAAAAPSEDDLVQVPRSVVRTLAVELLESGRPISDDARLALLALIRPVS